jgi:hypothetical protein
VSDVGDLLELLHGAADRWATVQTAIRSWRHVELGRRATERWAHETRQRGGGVSIMAVAGEGTQPESYERVTRLWIAKPDRWRQEQDEHLSAGRGPLWWASSPDYGFMSNQGDPDTGHSDPLSSWAAHLAPARFIADVSFGDVRTQEERIVALVRPRATQSFGPSLPHGADEHVLSIDPERGIVLCIESFFEGTRFDLSELVDPVWDAEIPDEVFTLAPPPGEPVRSPRDLHRQVTLDDAVHLASFAVFAISELPDGHWRSHVHYNAAGRRHRDSLHITYHRADGRGFITVSQHPEQADHWARGEGHAQVQVEREGTHIAISSETYVEDELRALADKLERV